MPLRFWTLPPNISTLPVVIRKVYVITKFTIFLLTFIVIVSIYYRKMEIFPLAKFYYAVQLLNQIYFKKATKETKKEY